MRILHVIPHLGQGGAEAALVALIGAASPQVEHVVLTLLDVEPHFRPDVPVLRGKGRHGTFPPGLPLSVRRAVRTVRPDILHCWMYHANLLSVGALGLGVPILWSIHSASPAALQKRMTRLVNAACARLSAIVPDRIVYVAETARRSHESAGYSAARGVHIPNGIDTARFHTACPAHPRPGRLRIGLVARYDPVKGHHFLIDVLARHPLRDKVELVIAGQGCDAAPALRAHLAATGLLERTELHGAVAEVEHLYAGLDVLVVPSHSEALPMVVLEAGAMGVTVCASSVGDIPFIGLQDELLFEAGDSAACAAALSRAALCARRPGEAERLRRLVVDRFDVTAVARSYLALYSDLRAARAAGISLQRLI